MKKIIKFSKSYSNITEIKKSFYNDNLQNLKNSLKINSIYKKQPLRKNCKNCGSKKLLQY